ncbi:alpha/beta fold hydrolase BchO [Flavimaricola marinus]|uniref:Soluble epoxide hydrolase n=1 Tax=Flavimaricola marinus TaxID=1819565 RepID=A0A238LCG1_9RHOB|nr:alpha/beta fold hydrolase BchO [Flavimaricola marinus]SMY07094.1 Soluble epoxide hydrolase [Flavimaricola marinus]
MRWPEDAAGWPMAEHSRMVLGRPHRWHVQEAGEGPTLILIHGAGGATQSWRGLFPLLAKTHHVVAVDLPGQGFTQMGARGRCGLDPMAEDLLSLVRQQGWTPAALIGHSAGVAVALRMVELGLRVPVVGINAALANFKGVAGWLFPTMAKVLALTPMTATVFAATASEATVRNLIKGTGSRLDAEGLALYRRLATDRTHVDATLTMMAQWRLDGLLARLPRIDVPVDLIVGTGDLAVPPATSDEAAALLPDARVTALTGLGHLAHEEAPAEVAEAILRVLSRSD